MRRRSLAFVPLLDRSARDDEAAEVFQKACELRISGRRSDSAMKREIFIDCALAAIDDDLNCVKSVDDLLELCRGGTLGGEPCCFDLDPSAQLHDIEHFAQR